MIVCCLKTFFFMKYSFSLFQSINFLLIYQQIVDELTFSDADILQIKLMISLFSCSGSGPQQCFGNQDSYVAQILQCLVQPDGILNEVSEEFSSFQLNTICEILRSKQFISSILGTEFVIYMMAFSFCFSPVTP